MKRYLFEEINLPPKKKENHLFSYRNSDIQEGFGSKSGLIVENEKLKKLYKLLEPIYLEKIKKLELEDEQLSSEESEYNEKFKKYLPNANEFIVATTNLKERLLDKEEIYFLKFIRDTGGDTGLHTFWPNVFEIGFTKEELSKYINFI